MSVLLEICVDSLASVRAAEAGGADRLELCQGLSEGGTTPTLGFLESAREATKLPIFVLLRPRAGGFVYGKAEVQCLLRDLESARENGAQGFVTGALTQEGGLDEDFLKRVLDAAGPLPVTFHRAFDVCAQPLELFDRLLDLGVQRLLTSGHAPRVEEGMDLLADLVQRGGDRMIVMPGGGLREETAVDLASLVRAREYHGSASRPVSGPAEFPARVADESRVARLKELLSRASES